jgi:serine/threonine protein kinase
MVTTKKNYKNKGGRAIASGGYGCVFSPALKCQNASKREKNKISKLMTVRHADQEFNEINNIKDKLDSIKHYKNYFLIYDATLCRPSKLTATDLVSYSDKCTALPKNNITKKNINSNLTDILSLNLPNGGLPVDDYLYSNGSYDKLYSVHIALVNLLKKGIMHMNEKHIYHSDIKDSNILIDDTDADVKARLIDWGLTVEYNPNSSEKFPINWKNRPLQFNVPFSIILFTDLFYERYSKYLKDGGEVEEAALRPFAIDYLNEWIKERGSGHYKSINEIMFLLYSSELTSISDQSKPNIIETEFTMPYIIDYIIDVLVHYTKFKEDGSLNLREYLNKVYIKIVDVWGFIMVYYPLLEMLSNNYFNLNENELKIFKQLQYIFNEYLYTPRHEPIDIEKLLSDLKTLGNLIYTLSNNSKKYSSKSSASSIQTRKNSKSSSSIFKKKKLNKKFKKTFLLSLK